MNPSLTRALALVIAGALLLGLGPDVIAGEHAEIRDLACSVMEAPPARDAS